jgi:hypothetical protein
MPTIKTNSGIHTIIKILSHNPKELFITGFSLWKNRNGNVKSLYSSQHLLPNNTQCFNYAAINNHVLIAFKNLVKEYSHVIKVDTTLQSILDQI